MLNYLSLKSLKNFFFDRYLNRLESNILIFVFLFIWIFEWIFIYNYILSLNTYVRIVYPYRIPVFLMLSFLFFIYIWGVSVWRRTQFGKFTRGDRKLWSKGFASFWVLELSTLLGLVIAAAWMNWGPVPLIPRKFNISKKSFLIELTFFTYALWILYLMRFSIKWNKWKNQVFLTIFILLVIFYLIWRDILLIIGRENITVNNGVRWKFIRANIITYSIAPNWWTLKFINYRNIISKDSFFFSLNNFLKNVKTNNNILLQNSENIMTTYEKYYYINITKSGYDCNSILVTNYSDMFYPRRIGFFTKRVSMWTFFLFLKIWHHIMLYIWWFFYLIRLFSRKKNSYQLLAICHFNIYCCFLIILAIYIYCLFPKFIIFFRFFKDKPKMISIIRIYSWKNYLTDYFVSLLNLNFFSYKTNTFLINHNNIKKNYLNPTLLNRSNVLPIYIWSDLNPFNFYKNFSYYIKYRNL